MSFELSNVDGYFNDPTDSDSFFFGFLTTYRTLVSVEAGYIGDDDNYYPSTPTTYVGIISEGIERKNNGLINLKTDHISKIFAEFQAEKVAGLGATQTASDIITNIQNHVDSNGVTIFQKYISTWNIDTTTTNYNMATSTTLQNKNCWDLMRDLSVAENKTLFISGDGEFNFVENVSTGTSIYHLSGPGDDNIAYGRNVLKEIKTDESVKHIYNRVRIKYDIGDTSTSYYTLDEEWDWGDSSSSFRYGVRPYNYSNNFLSASTAAEIANTIYNKFKEPTLIVTGKHHT